MNDSLNDETIAATASGISGNAQHTKRRADDIDAGGLVEGEESDAKRRAKDIDAGGLVEGEESDAKRQVFIPAGPLAPCAEGDFGSSDEDGLPDVPKPSGQAAGPVYLETSLESTLRHVLEQKKRNGQLTEMVDALKKQLASVQKAHSEEVGRLTNVLNYISSLLQCDDCGKMCPLLWLECESGSVYCKVCFDKAPPAGEVTRIRKFTLLKQVIAILDDAQ